MRRIVAIGRAALVSGFALAGADVREVNDDAGALEAWASLPDDTALVVLTAEAAAAVPDLDEGRPDVLRAVLPC